MAITLLGFAIAIWQIIGIRRAADAARDASIRLARRVRNREFLVQLSTAHNHLETARTRLASGSPGSVEIASSKLEDAIRSIIDAEGAGGTQEQIDTLWRNLNGISIRLGALTEPLPEHPDYGRLIAEFRRESDTLQRLIAQLRYRYDDE